MIVDIGLTVVGLGILLAGAWLLVRSATHLATAFGLSPVIIGVTVVAFGTSAPEFVVSVTAAAGGVGGLAVGNVFGSNVMNVALVIGIAAALNPLDVDSRLLRRELPILGGATILVILFGLNGTLGSCGGGGSVRGAAGLRRPVHLETTRSLWHGPHTHADPGRT